MPAVVTMRVETAVVVTSEAEVTEMADARGCGD